MYKQHSTIADLQLIKVLLESNLSAYEIERKTGVTRTIISKYRSGKSSLDNIRMKSAIALTTFSEKQINIKASELLDKMKHSHSFEYVIVTNKTNKTLLKNQGTGNLQSIYNIHNNGIHYYGVYGDIVNGQLDSRKSTDKEIKMGIKKMLRRGNLELRTDLIKKKIKECSQ